MDCMRNIIVAVILSGLSATVKAQVLAVSTDVAWLATQTYNAAAELTISSRSTLSLNIMGNYHPWALHDMRMIVLQPEWRYYFSGRAMAYHYVGIHGLVANYDFVWKDERHHGDAIAGGFTLGYALPLSERWNVDFHAGLGLAFYHEEAKSVSTMILPTRIGVSLSYILR